MLAISSYYIAKDKETFQTLSNKSSGTDSRKKRAAGIGFQDLNLAGYSHQNVDRFAVLLDIWTNEVNFLEMKRNVNLIVTLICFLGWA